MFIEILFAIMFFVLPIAGMFVTIFVTRYRQAHQSNGRKVQKQSVFWDMPRGSTKVQEYTTKHFFNWLSDAYVHRFNHLDTS